MARDVINIHIENRPGQSILPRYFAESKPTVTVDTDYFERICPLDEEVFPPLSWEKADPSLGVASPIKARIVGHPFANLKLSAAEVQFYGKWANEEREKLRQAGLSPLAESDHAIDALRYAIMNREKELVGLIPEGYEAPEMEFYVDGERVEFDEEAKDLKKLEINQELNERIIWALRGGWTSGTELEKVSILAKLIESELLEANGLTAKDIYALAAGDFIVKSKYEVGQYYSAGKRIFLITEVAGRRIAADVFHGGKRHFVSNDQFYINSNVDAALEPATSREVELYKRAMHFRRQNRRLNDFKVGDIVLLRGLMQPIYETMGHMNDQEVERALLICPVEKRGDKLAD